MLSALEGRKTPLAQVVAAALRCRVDHPELVVAFEAALQKAYADTPADQVGRKMYGAALLVLPRQLPDQQLIGESLTKRLIPDPRMFLTLANKLPAPYAPVNEVVTPDDAVRAVAILAAADKTDDFGEVVDRLLRVLACVPEQRCDEAFMESYKRFREREVGTGSEARRAVIALRHLDVRRALPIAEAVRAWEFDRMRRLPIAPWEDESALDEQRELYKEVWRLTNAKGASGNKERLAQLEDEIEATSVRWLRKALWDAIERLVKELRERAAAEEPGENAPAPK
ncbi:MAG: hypothetical protein ACK4WH_11915 [Phycisphaerales bacterium]